MFKCKDSIKCETDKCYKNNVDILLNKYRETLIKNMGKAKNKGEYYTIITTDRITKIEKEVLKILRKELRKKGYHCGFIWCVEGWSSFYYKMKISWK